MVTGSTSDPNMLHGISAVAGADVLTHETKPVPGEPDGNASHYVIQEIKHPDYPYQEPNMDRIGLVGFIFGMMGFKMAFSLLVQFVKLKKVVDGLVKAVDDLRSKL
jgi:hypothetical protein